MKIIVNWKTSNLCTNDNRELTRRNSVALQSREHEQIKVEKSVK